MIKTVPLLFLAMACATTEPHKIPIDIENDLLSKRKIIIKNNIDGGTPEKSIHELKPLLHGHPRDPELRNLMGLALLSLRDNDLAINYFKQAYKIKPMPRYALNLSSSYIETKQNLKAIKTINNALKKWPNYKNKERFYNNLGYLFFKMNKTKNSIKWYKKSIAELPIFYNAHLGLARVYSKNKQFNRAIKSYYKAKKYCLRCLEPSAELARIFLFKRNYITAKRVIQDYLAVDNVPQPLFSRAKSILRTIKKYELSFYRKTNNKTKRKF